MNKYYLLSLLFCSCSTLKENTMGERGKDYVIQSAIFDFISTESEILKNDKTFFISTADFENYIGVSIMGDPNSFLLIMGENDTISYRAFPTGLIENEGKLFFWYDSTKTVTDTIISTLYKYNFVDTMIVNEYIPDRIIDDNKKVVNYFFYKKKISKYKKKKTKKSIQYCKP